MVDDKCNGENKWKFTFDDLSSNKIYSKVK